MGKTAVSIIAGLTVSRNRPIASAHNWFHEVWGLLGYCPFNKLALVAGTNK